MARTKWILASVGLGVVVLAYLWPGPPFHFALVSGKRVLVTGASSGIGEQLAYQYARAGASVFITARRKALLEKVVETCKILGSPKAQFGYIQADMADMDQTDIVVEAAVKHPGGLDQIILNHALIPVARLFEKKQESFDLLKKIMDVNMRSFVHLSMHALPHLKRSNGSIGVVSSVAGKYGFPFFTTYCASKHALHGFFAGLRQELTRFNVSVTMAILGGIDTEGLTKLMTYMKQHYKSSKTEIEQGRPPASPDACALEIMRGTTMRERDIYFPKEQYIYPLVLFKEFLVRIVEVDENFHNMLNEISK